MVHKMDKNQNFENSSYRIQKYSTFQLSVRGNLNIFIFTHFMGHNVGNFSEKINFSPKIGIFGPKNKE